MLGANTIPVRQCYALNIKQAHQRRPHLDEVPSNDARRDLPRMQAERRCYAADICATSHREQPAHPFFVEEIGRTGTE